MVNDMLCYRINNIISSIGRKDFTVFSPEVRQGSKLVVYSIASILRFLLLTRLPMPEHQITESHKCGTRDNHVRGHPFPEHIPRHALTLWRIIFDHLGDS